MPAFFADRVMNPPSLLHSASSSQYPLALLNHVWDGLAVFAIFTIVKRLIRRWTSTPERISDETQIDGRPPPSDLTQVLVDQQRLHRHFFPNPSYYSTMDDKSRVITRTFCDADPSQPSLDGGPAPLEGIDNGRVAGGPPSPAWSRSPPSARIGLGMERRLLNRVPPPPPLTPPEPSTVVGFAFDERSIPPRNRESGPSVDDSFIHQPNPDYLSFTSTAVVDSGPESPSTATRHAYAKMLPAAISISPVPGVEARRAEEIFGPSSYPPSSLALPPPPPQQDHENLAADDQSSDIEVQGEVFSVMNDNGAGWKRHTRVYGGGVCLACAAAGGEGGFYGEHVRPEDKR